MLKEKTKLEPRFQPVMDFIQSATEVMLTVAK